MNDEENRKSNETDEATPNQPECDSLSAPLSCECSDTEENADELLSGAGDADAYDGEALTPVTDEAVSNDSVQDADSSASADSSGTPAEDATEQLRQLRSELTSLRAEIAARDERLSRMSAEYAEFRTLYPSVPFEAIDDSVMEDVKNGIPLSAAYALFERRRQLAAEQAARINAENSHRTPGALRATDEDYFSPDEVRKMTPGEVRTNYQKILQSMRKWH